MIKKKVLLLLLLFTFLVFHLNCVAQKKNKSGFWKALNTADNTDTTTALIHYEDYVYKPNIKTVQLHNESFDMSQPILSLGAEGKLKLSFDDLDADYKNYSFTIIHCNANWEPSDLSAAEYIDGFQSNMIIDYHYSLNTLQKYTHYNVVFPDDATHITKSGNYILKVFLDGNADNVILTKRFMVYQDKISIQGKVGAASIISDRNFKQEVDFTIDHSGYDIADPFGDLHVVITQNNHWDNAKTTLKPSIVKDNELVYDYDVDNVFTGGNEFRNFDIKSIRYHSERIASVKTDSGLITVNLLPDEKRTFKKYSTLPDLNGNYAIKIQEGTNSEIEAEYCYVHFFLQYPEILTDANFYVFGAYNGWRCAPENLMKYNVKNFGYECTMYLKQGYYNYEYVYIKNGTTTADETLVEGMHYETENDYTIYVYHRQQGTFYDQLIGVKHLNTVAK